jgi:hypothetical protein
LRGDLSADVPNTNGIPQAWTTVILGYTSGRALNRGSSPHPTTGPARCRAVRGTAPLGELDRAVGIAADDWWMTDEHGAKVSMLDMWLDHVGDETFNWRPSQDCRLHRDGLPGADRDRLLRR